MRTLFFLIVGASFALAVFTCIYGVWRGFTSISKTTADIRHGRGIFLTFKYTDEEWQYFKQNLSFTRDNGKVCFTRNHIYLTDGNEEILYEISGEFRISALLRNVCVENDFLVFTVRTKELIRGTNWHTYEYLERKPDSPDNLFQYEIPIPAAQKDKTDELIRFYQENIDDANEHYE